MKILCLDGEDKRESLENLRQTFVVVVGVMTYNSAKTKLGQYDLPD